jgi:hypothetical protein
MNKTLAASVAEAIRRHVKTTCQQWLLGGSRAPLETNDSCERWWKSSRVTQDCPRVSACGTYTRE